MKIEAKTAGHVCRRATLPADGGVSCAAVKSGS